MFHVGAVVQDERNGKGTDKPVWKDAELEQPPVREVLPSAKLAPLSARVRCADFHRHVQSTTGPDVTEFRASKAENRRSGWRELLRQSLAGSTQDYTQGSVRRAAVLLAIPMMLEMAMESLFTIVDIYFVSSLGAEAVAVVGLTEAVMTLVYALGIGFGMGATAYVSRRIGEHDAAGARVVAAQAVWLCVLIALLLGATAPFARDILSLMGATPAVIDIGVPFTTIMLGGAGTVASLFILNGVFRGAGDAAIAMRSMWLANGINLVLDPCLIFGWGPFPALGLTGAAIATTCGRACGVVYLLLRFAVPGSRVRLGWRDLVPVPTIIHALLKVSLGGVAQSVIATSSWILMMRLVAPYGSAAVAGYTIAIRILVFSLLPAWGLANAAATLVGQNLGAGRALRAEQSVWEVARISAAMMGVIGLVSVVCAPAIVSIFSRDPAVMAHAVSCLRIVASGYLFYAVGMIVTQAFNGAGDTVTPTAINLVGFWILQIPLAWALTHYTGLGPTGVFIAVLGAESVMALLAVAVFRRGAWKTKRL